LNDASSENFALCLQKSLPIQPPWLVVDDSRPTITNWAHFNFYFFLLHRVSQDGWENADQQAPPVHPVHKDSKEMPALTARLATTATLDKTATTGLLVTKAQKVLKESTGKRRT
jgi:hypothetical protein